MLSGSNPQQQQGQAQDQGGINFGLLSPLASKLHEGVVGQAAQTASGHNDTADLLSGLGKLVSGIKQGLAPKTQADVQPQSSTNQGLIGGYVQNQLGMTDQQNLGNSKLSQIAAQTLTPEAKNLYNDQYKPNLVGADPDLVKNASGLMADLKAQGFRPVIAEGVRTKEQQAEKVKLGYSHTMNSNHIGGKAFDIVDARYGWDDKNHPNEIAAFADAMAKTAPKYGLFSGTAWKSFGPHGDFAHVQLQPKDPNQLNQSHVNQQLDQPTPNPALTQAASNQNVNQQFTDHSLPRGIRNNNPGNLEIGQFTQNLPGYTQGADPRFASFQTPEQGLGALSTLLTTKYNGQSLNQIISHYAPSSENDTQSYVNNLAKSTGLDPNKPVNMSDPGIRQKVMQGIVKIENGNDPYTAKQYNAAIGMQSAMNSRATPSTAAPTFQGTRTEDLSQDQIDQIMKYQGQYNQTEG